MRGSRRALRSPSGRRVFGDSAAGRDPGCEDWVGPWPCPRPGHSLGQPPVLWGPSGGVWMCASGGVHNTPTHTQRHTRAHMRVQARHTGTHKCVHTHVHTEMPNLHTPTCAQKCMHTRVHTQKSLCARTPRARTDTEGGLTAASSPMRVSPDSTPAGGVHPSPCE